jgi:transposase
VNTKTPTGRAYFPAATQHVGSYGNQFASAWEGPCAPARRSCAPSESALVGGCIWSSTARSSRNRVHSSLIAFGHQCPVSDLFGVAGRKLLSELDIPEPWRSHVEASLALIDDLERRIDQIERWLRRSGADHRYIPLLMTAPGIGWITGFTIASQIGEISRFSSPTKLTGYTGLCPRVNQSGEIDQRGPVSKHGPKYLRRGLMEAAIAASSHRLYRERYQRTKRRLGRQRGAKVAQIELARKLTEAIWYMLSRNQPFKPFAPAGAVFALTA